MPYVTVLVSVKVYTRTCDQCTDGHFEQECAPVRQAANLNLPPIWEARRRADAWQAQHDKECKGALAALSA